MRDEERPLNAPSAPPAERPADEYDPDRSWFPVSDGEIHVARHFRREQHRTPPPRMGDHVLYRHDRWGDVTDALVAGVHMGDTDDLNIWEHDLTTGQRTGRYHPDPWPLLLLHTDRGRIGVGPIETREARLRGSPGWLPLSWLDVA